MISGRGGAAMRGGRIRPPRRTLAQSGADDFDTNWQALQSALRDIHLSNASGLAFEQLYRHAYKIVLKKAGERLYNEVKGFEEGWFAERVKPAIIDHIDNNLISVTLDDIPDTSVIERRAVGERFLKEIRHSWERHNTAMNMIADILMYLDRGYSQDHHRPSIFATTIGLFRDQILRAGRSVEDRNCLVFDIFNATILDQINMEREGDVIDKALLRSCVTMLESLHETDEENENEKLYLTQFEPVYIDSSHVFYKTECERLLREADASSWLRSTQRRLREEDERCRTTISVMSVDKIAHVVEQELISKHLEEFMNLEGSGFRAMIDNDRVDDLRILYQLISRVDSQKSALRHALSARVIALGTEIEKVLKSTDFSVPQTVEDAGAADAAPKPKQKTPGAAAQQTASAIKWVDDVLSLKDRFDRIWATCFSEDLQLQTTLTKSFSEFINSFDSSPEYLSLFIDDALRRGIKGMTEAEVDVVLEKAITLLRFLNDKDRFEGYYQKHLGRRLLGQKSESHEVETEMISRMKRELGNNFTHKFEGMFRDMKLSKEMTESYRKHVRDLGATNDGLIELAINVLGGNNWPKEIMGRQNALQGQTSAETNYPADIKRLQDSFFKFYSKGRVGRKLTWIGNAGTADIRCVFPKIPGKTGPLGKERRYELSVSTYGMVVLQLFNDLGEDEWLTLEEIQGQTNIPQQELVNVLTSLSVVKTSKVLVKDPPTKSIAKPGDRFAYNREFVSKAFKIKTHAVSASNRVENDEERKETHDKNLDTRKYVVDAAVVRIMKQRKELLHSQLITEVIQQLTSQFKPEVGLIKSRIEDLINREYIERADLADGKPAYRYVA